MRIYWLTVVFVYISWYIVSLQYPEPSWWSIFSSNQSTHTPMMEHVSLIKVTFIALIVVALAYLIRKKIEKRN